jgi:hypothetical protein
MQLLWLCSLWPQATLHRTALTETLESAASVTDSAADAGRITVDEPPLKKWKLLAAKQAGIIAVAAPNNDPQLEMTKYLLELRNSAPARDSLQFWHARKVVYPCLSVIAQDYLCAPASQAYVERIFSVCGLLTAGRRNRMDKSLEMRVFLQLNSHLID